MRYREYPSRSPLGLLTVVSPVFSGCPACLEVLGNATPDVPTQTDPLEQMLADPEIRQSLAVIVANAPTLAALASMGTLLLERGYEITDNVNASIRQLREESEEGGPSQLGQAIGSLADLAPLAPALAQRTESITGLLDSAVLRPEVVDVIGRLGEAAVEADQATRGQQASVGSVFAILRELKDPKVQETLAFLFTFAKSFGQRQAGA